MMKKTSTSIFAKAATALLLMMLTAQTAWAQYPPLQLWLYPNDEDATVGANIPVVYNFESGNYQYSLSNFNPTPSYCPEFIREGHTIKGWVDKSMGITYGRDETVTLTGNMTLYAIWDDTPFTMMYVVTSESTGTAQLTGYYGINPTGILVIPASVTIGGNVYDVTSIREDAFHKCTGLTSVTIPGSVTEICSNAFSGCTSLSTVTIYAPELTTYGICAFFENHPSRKIYVFNNCIYNYKKASAWDDYDSDIEPITFTANEGKTGEFWTTYYNDMVDVRIPSGAQVFKAALNGTVLTLTEIFDGVINKGQGVVLKSTSSSIIPGYSKSGSITSYLDNSLVGTMTRIDNPGNAFVLNKKNGTGVGFYKLSDSGHIGANQAYLTNSSGSAPAFFGFEEATGIKAIDNGQLTIDNEVYDLQGRRVAQPTKGLYIVNGKKIIIK